ncbi:MULTISPECIES: hypothetical protein [unclassified Ensifer]|uniref:hypothetical protein n=1 Tax=unclassified Ensifer TaxID=2633371 RepID=UPI0008138DAB|nr:MULTISPECIES: hypothetical protein [unclassified Ensifer]OCP05727.1 hypothetical protein BBX50_04365 [Ensifer sp. LC11]OCP06472.1 hypothetical protein BC374_04425 [Ensifer sp. LC13]OCP06802.1 hypothetical protein BC362_11740 [Ensifer sp. LC14]OCP31289.1 hypothetical protein BC364_05670 [Ensifer sp. LC499]
MSRKAEHQDALNNPTAAPADFIGESQPRPAGILRRIRRSRNLSGALDGLIIVVSGLVAVLICEMLLRFVPSLQLPVGEGEYVFCGMPRARHQSHALYGYTEVPGNSYFERFSPFDPWNHVQINRDGFRDNATRDGAAVFVLGDSMVRGSLVKESETFSALLNTWHPQLLFKNYGTGGYGQPNEIRLYEDKAPNIPHKLVIAGLSLSTDIEDNAERAVLTPSSVEITVEPAGSGLKKPSLALQAHLFLWQNSKLYNWFYSTLLRPYVGDRASRRDMGQAIELTRRLFVRLADDARANGAELLVVILPGWAELAGRDDGLQPSKQREMIKAFAAATPGVYVVDPTEKLAANDPMKTYGIGDKHLSPLGHFLVAEAIDRWLINSWDGRQSLTGGKHEFVKTAPIEPDCLQLSQVEP